MSTLLNNQIFWLFVAISSVALIRNRAYRGARLLAEASHDPPEAADFYLPKLYWYLGFLPIMKWSIALVLAYHEGLMTASLAVGLVTLIGLLVPFPYRIFSPIYRARMSRIARYQPDAAQALQESLNKDWARAWWFKPIGDHPSK